MPGIKLTIGLSQRDLNTSQVPVIWDTDALINAHVAISGDSGTGKTHKIRQLIEAILMGSDKPPRIHILDVHGDIDIPGASEVMFSAGSPYGFNPLQLDPDLHFGGVRKCVANFIAGLNRTASRKLGPKQEAVLRTMLYELFTRNGFELDDPKTWRVASAEKTEGRVYLETTYNDKEKVKAAGAKWDHDATCWWVAKYEGEITNWRRKRMGNVNPTLTSLIAHAQQQLRMTFLGTDQRALALLEELNRKYSALQGKLKKALRDSGSDLGNEAAEEDLQKSKTAAREAYENYLDAITSGKELDEVFKYDSVDVLKSVIQILENLDGSGIFRDSLPPFAQYAPVWRYNIKALTDEEKLLFINFRAQQIFANARRQGETTTIRDIIIVDEAKRAMSDDPDNPLTRIVLEARKFGLNAWLASQSPTHIPLDVYASIGTKYILGIDRIYWKQATSKYGISEELLAGISPRKTLITHMKRQGETSPQWQAVVMQ